MNSTVQDTQLNIKSLILSLLLAYVTATLLLGSAILYANHKQWQRLAQSYSQASRHSLLLNDLRQTVNSLLPAANDGFSAIAIADRAGRVIVGIPNDSALKDSGRSFYVTIEIPVFSSEKSDIESKIATFSFVYSARTSFFVVLSGATILLLLFIAFFLWLRIRLDERHAAEVRRKQTEFEHRLTLQIAHDIRSPLTAINVCLNGLTELPSETRMLLEKALKRINDISTDLLEQSKKSWANHSNSLINANQLCASVDMVSLVRDVYREKQTMLADAIEVELRLDFDAKDQEIRCLVNERELLRVLSNLINNAVESLNNIGQVTLALRSSRSSVTIVIADNGQGIPSELLARLGKERLSYGKEAIGSGSGLGLIHAQSAIQSMNGKLLIQSRIGAGTIVSIILPKSESAPNNADWKRK